MGAHNTTVHLNPDVFRWAIMGAGWNAEELSEKTGIRLESIRGWEKDNAPMRIAELKKIAKAIKRPISILLLPEPPDEKELPNYRKISGSEPIRPSKKMLDVIRHARYVRSNANELLQMRSESTQPRIAYKSLQDDPEEAAESERTELGVNLAKNPEESMEEFAQRVYLDLKEKIESLNIFVLQMAMKIDESRGFSLSDDRYPKIIMINSKEKSRPKIFTLLHEYAHILLREDGICPVDSDDTDQIQRNEMKVERWCNNFAGAFIMPKNAMLAELNNMPDHKPEQIVASLTRKFCASKKATTVRILNLLGSGTRHKEYTKYNKTLQTTFTAQTGGSGRSKGRNMVKECINHNGVRYVRLVVDSRDKGLVTTYDMVRYLDLNTKYFEKLECMI